MIEAGVGDLVSDLKMARGGAGLHMVHRQDPNSEDERWHTIGMARNVVVVHTWPRPEHEMGVEVGRIVSARKATAHERRAYEDGNF